MLDLKAVFDRHDRDRSGTLKSAELVHVANELGLFISKAEADIILKQFDLDNSGEVDFDEFLWFFGTFEEKKKQSAIYSSKKGLQLEHKCSFSFDAYWD